MAYKFNPFTGKLDIAGSSTNDFGSDGIILSSENKRWTVTVDDTGALITTELIVSTNAGQPMGLLLCLTYS